MLTAMRGLDSRRRSKRATEPVVALMLVALSAVGALALTLPAQITGTGDAGPGAAAEQPSRPARQETAAKAAEAVPEWREQNFANVAIVDARTVAAGDLRITLAGLALPRADEICPTIDGRAEACTSRGVTQLELLTRWRKVSCRYRETAPGEAVGSCRVGESDLAERMLRTRTVHRDGEG
jgi:hypothetical protein